MVAAGDIFNSGGRFDKAGIKGHVGGTVKLVSALTFRNPAHLMNWLHVFTGLYPASVH